MKAKIALALLTVLIVTGCASVPMASPDLDAKAKQFTLQTNKSNLYIYRNEHLGKAIPMTVSVNGTTLGQTAAQTYFWLQLNPGEYNIESLTENVSTLKLNVESGRDYFVWQEVKMGLWAARSMLQQVDEKTGKEGVLESKLINQNTYTIEPLKNSSTTNTVVTGSTQQKLKELQGIRKEGLISEEEYQKKRRQILKDY